MENNVFSLVKENTPLPGMTVSGEVLHGITCFSLAEGTDISAESYPVPVLQYNLSGTTELSSEEHGSRILKQDELVVKEAGSDIGIRALTDSVYLEIPLRKDKDMNRCE